VDESLEEQFLAEPKNSVIDEAKDGYLVSRPSGPGDKFLELFDEIVEYVSVADPWRTRLIIVEAVEGTWLSHITKWYLDDPLLAYSSVITLLTPELDVFIDEHFRVISLQTEKENKLSGVGQKYQRGQVPSHYEETVFNPDLIYPGQRFVLFIPIDSPEPAREDIGVEILPEDRIWWGWAAEMKADAPMAFGAYSGGESVGTALLFNMSDSFEKLRYVWFTLPSYRVGLGGGASGSALCIAFAHGVESWQSLDVGTWKLDYDFEWGPFGTSRKFKLAAKPAFRELIIAAKKAGLSREILRKVCSKREFFLKLKKIAMVGKKTIQAVAEPNKLHTLSIPIPYTEGGIHTWFGVQWSGTPTIFEGLRSGDEEIKIP